MNFISRSSYQKLIKPCAVKWCGICKQLKKKLLKLYSANDLTMASVDTELIPSLRDEFENRAGIIQTVSSTMENDFFEPKKVLFMEWNLFQHCYYLMDRISFNRFLLANFLLSNKWLMIILLTTNQNVEKTNLNSYGQCKFSYATPPPSSELISGDRFWLFSYVP